MSSGYFQFKQFRIEQDRCAMKVSTDACIQGAWTPLTASVQKVWDIGAGTGLLSLMIAQRCSNCTIDAVDIDLPAAEQASANVRSSPFTRRVSVHHTDALNWAGIYDLVICNPPFFTASLKGPDEQRNLARHTGDLNLETVAAIIAKSLSDQGYASILLPATEQQRWQKAMSVNGLFCKQLLSIKPFDHAEANRIVFICSKEQTLATEETLVIYAAPKVYTAEFTALMHPFYLNL
jgi:tRNA1Val (adenine37-N6)-methyltransferase